MSVCTTATCDHGRGVFIWLGDGPDDDGTYPWVHSTSSPDSPGHLTVCDLMKPATAEEAGEICRCGHSAHKAAPGPIPAGMIAKPMPCTVCDCPDFRHRPEDIVPKAATPRQAMQAQISDELHIPYNPRWKSPHCDRGSCTYCDNDLCTHRCHGTAIDGSDESAKRPAPPRPAKPVDAGEQGALFDLEAISCP